MTDTAVATIDQRDSRPPMVVLRDRFELRRGELKAALPSDVSVDSFIRAAMTSAALNPDILGCSWQSIWNACLRACRDGLLPDGVEGAIVPFKGTATWIPMYQGLLRRFRRSGQFRWITANLVRAGEEFTHYIDEHGEHFRHVPGDNFGAAIEKIYALATTKDGGVFVAVLSIAEANKIRAMSRTTREDAPWRQWESEMYKKTALRRLSKYLPSARDLMIDDDLPQIEAPSAAPELPRASAPPHTPVDDTGQQGGGEQAPVESSPVTPGADGQPAAADQSTAPADDPLALAYRRGQEDKAKGVQRRALPGEYRDPSQTRLALAWQAGHDGGTMPTFANTETATGETTR